MNLLSATSLLLATAGFMLTASARELPQVSPPCGGSGPAPRGGQPHAAPAAHIRNPVHQPQPSRPHVSAPPPRSAPHPVPHVQPHPNQPSCPSKATPGHAPVHLPAPHKPNVPNKPCHPNTCGPTPCKGHEPHVPHVPRQQTPKPNVPNKPCHPNPNGPTPWKGHEPHVPHVPRPQTPKPNVPNKPCHPNPNGPTPCKPHEQHVPHVPRSVTHKPNEPSRPCHPKPIVTTHRPHVGVVVPLPEPSKPTTGVPYVPQVLVTPQPNEPVKPDQPEPVVTTTTTTTPVPNVPDVPEPVVPDQPKPDVQPDYPVSPLPEYPVPTPDIGPVYPLPGTPAPKPPGKPDDAKEKAIEVVIVKTGVKREDLYEAVEINRKSKTGADGWFILILQQAGGDKSPQTTQKITLIVDQNENMIRQKVKAGDWQGLIIFLTEKSKNQGIDVDWSKVLSDDSTSSSVWRMILMKWASTESRKAQEMDIYAWIGGDSDLALKRASTIILIIRENPDEVQRLVREGNTAQLQLFLEQKAKEKGLEADWGELDLSDNYSEGGQWFTIISQTAGQGPQGLTLDAFFKMLSEQYGGGKGKGSLGDFTSGFDSGFLQQLGGGDGEAGGSLQIVDITNLLGSDAGKSEGLGGLFSSLGVNGEASITGSVSGSSGAL